MSDTDPSKRSSNDSEPEPRHRPWRTLATLLVVLYVGALAALAYWCSSEAGRWDSLVWTPGEGPWVVGLAAQVGSNVAKHLVLFLGLSFLVGTALGPHHEDASLGKVLLCTLIGFVLSFGISYAVRLLVHGMPPLVPSFAATTFLLLVCLWGSWLGATWMANRSTLLWALKQTVLVALVACGGSAALAWAAFSTQPLDIASEDLSTEDRRRLVKLFRDHDPRDLEVDETTELTITEHELNQLASWGLSLLPQGQKARLGLAEDQVAIQATFQLPPNPAFNLHLNLATSGQVVTRAGELGFAPSSLEIGRIKVPDWLLGLGGPLIIGSAWRTDVTEPFFQSLKRVQVTEGLAKVAYGQLDIKKGMVRDALVELGMVDDLEPAIQAQLTHLIALAERSPQLSFAQCLETTFAVAKQRSMHGDAIRENRAAIMTLGYALGHSKLKTLLGANIPRPTPIAWQRFGAVKLRNRSDWRQHFTVSAALQVLANALVSLDVGVLKEELDADGGSGFSFGDLLADRAGTMFAVKATQSDASARALQERVVSGFVEAEFMPAGSDLPEGLSARQFQAQYGGIGGERYEQLLAEIDRRIATCAAYQDR